MSISGGFLGLTSFLALKDIDGGVEIVIVLVFAGLYATGIIGGILFSLNKKKKALLKLYYFLQIPLFSSLVFGYQFLSVFGLYAGINLFQAKASDLTFGFRFEWLGKWAVSWSQEQPLAIGVNLIACVLLILICTIDYSNLELEPDS